MLALHLPVRGLPQASEAPRAAAAGLDVEALADGPIELADDSDTPSDDSEVAPTLFEEGDE